MKFVMYIVSFLVLFAGSAAGSWYLYARNKAAEAPDSQGAAAASPSLPLTTEPEGGGPLPVAVRPKPISAEDIYRFGTVIRQREAVLDQREKQIAARENRLKLMSEDIHAEQLELEALQAKIHSQLESAESLLARIAREKKEAEQLQQAVAKQREEFQKTQTEVDATEAQNMRKMADWFQNMEETRAAEYLRELADNGQLAMAVQLLSNFEERDAAKILDALDDPALVRQLTEQFKTLKQPEKKKR